MKKLAIGCAVVALVVLVVVAVGGVFVWNRYFKPLAGAVQQFSQVAEIEKQVTNTSPFTAPATGELTGDMVERFAKVQREMETKLGSRMQELKAKYDQIDQSMKSERREASFAEAMGALKDLSTLLVDAKKVQVQALNASSFSLREYEWVRGQVYAAIGMQAVGFDVKDFKKMAEQGGRPSMSEKEPPSNVPDRNRELVAPYEKKLQEWAPFAFFGL